jgi:SAM-dependent methyltransferase
MLKGEDSMLFFRVIIPKPIRTHVRNFLRLRQVAAARIRMSFKVEPLSKKWGFDRGIPIHRYYLEQFLEASAFHIKGTCLEFQEDSYTTRFGGLDVSKVDILHIDDTNPEATVIADLTKPNDIPSDSYDCIICTHVLHLLIELNQAIAELHRILKPGGVLLVAVPFVSMYKPGLHDIWRFTPEGLMDLLSRVFGQGNVQIKSYGNSLTTAGDLRGLVTKEFTQEELDYHDPRFSLEVCARAFKKDL